MRFTGLARAALAAAAVLSAPCGAQAAPGSYTAIDLGPFPHLAMAQATAMSPNGRIVGHVQQRRFGGTGFATAPHAGRPKLLGGLSGNFTNPQCVNATGQIAGFMTALPVSADHAFVAADSKSPPIDLGTFGGTTSAAYGVNAGGRVVGYAARSDEVPRAFATGMDGLTLQDLGALASGISAQARAINDEGHIVGYSTIDPSGEHVHAFITDANGENMRDLGTLPAGAWSVAYGINASGQVVGEADIGTGHRHGFVTGPHGVGMRDVDRVHRGVDSSLVAINSGGQAVGRKWPLGRFVAIVTDPQAGAIYSLSHLTTLPQGVHLREATGIDDQGRIVANGSDAHVYLLVPATPWTQD